jgi:hypothetical protein
VKEKLVIEIITLLVLLAVMGLCWKYFCKRFMYTQSEAEEEQHLRRLFGDAWRQARDLGD